MLLVYEKKKKMKKENNRTQINKKKKKFKLYINGEENLNFKRLFVSLIFFISIKISIDSIS